LKEIKAVIVGFGNIGKAFLRVLMEKSSFLENKLEKKVKIIAICEADGSLVNEAGISLKEALSRDIKRLNYWKENKNAVSLIQELDLDILFEFTPGNIESGEPGYTHIREALSNGINVITSNKAPLALKFSELMNLAKRNGVKLKYEATVGGAIPIINLRDTYLFGEEIIELYGILNGTTNYILSKMTSELLSLDSALKEAQELGIAEANASYDIDGIDTAAKVAILANSLLGKGVSIKDINICGIRDITLEAIELAKKHGYVIKLIGDCKKLEVAPKLIPKWSPLNVSGTLNAITLETDIAKKITLVGYGAGPRETCSAILADLIDVLRDL